MAESQTGLKFGHQTFNCNSCFSFTQRTSQSCLNHSQHPCEWVDADLGVLWVESEQILILQLKVGCPNFGPVQGSAIYPKPGPESVLYRAEGATSLTHKLC